MGIRKPPTVFLEQNAVISFQLDQTSGQFNRLRRAAGKLDEFQIFAMLAPVISFTSILAVAFLLPPVAHRGELGSGGQAVLPEIKHNRLASPGPQAWQRRKRTMGSSDIFSICHHIIVLIDQRPNIPIAVRVTAFVDYRICTHINEPAGF